MAIELPNGCPKNIPCMECRALARINDDESGGFICCGHLAKDARMIEQDRFRLCFKSKGMDEVWHLDPRDMIDTCSVLIQALSIDANFMHSGGKEDEYNGNRGDL